MPETPFSNPFTRNRTLPSVSFAKSDSERRNLKVPIPVFSYREMEAAYRSMSVPNQLPDPTAGGNGSVDTVQYDKFPLAPDEWTKWRFMRYRNSHGAWGDAWGNGEAAREVAIDRASREFARRSAMGNARLSAELESDEFRKGLLADVDAGKMFPLTKLEDVDEKGI